MFRKAYVAPTVRWVAGRTSSKERRPLSEDRSVSLSCEDSKMSEQSQDSGIQHSWSQGASRFSYIRASNSFHSYGRRSTSSRSLEDSCSCSSREDLLGSNENLERSRKRRPSRRSMRRSKSEYEEVIAMYRGEKEDTDSVFGSEDNILEVDRVGCSSNVSRFVRKHSVERMRQDSSDSCSKLTSSSGCSSSGLKKSRKKSKGSNTPCLPQSTQKSIPQISLSSDDKSVCSQPEVTENESRSQEEFQNEAPSLEMSTKDQSIESPPTCTDEIGHQAESTSLDIDSSVPLDPSACESECSENIDCSGLLSETGTSGTTYTGTQATTDTGFGQPDSMITPIRLRMHDAMVHTVHRIVDHLSSVRMQELLGRMHTRTGVSWLQVFTVSIMAVLSIAVWDISKTSAFKDSHIGKGLDRIGLLSYCEVLAAAIGSTLRHTYRWCGTHIPVLYSRGCELAGPYLQLVWEKSAVFAVALYTHIAALIDHLAQKLPALHAKIEEILPGVCEGIVHWTNIVYTAIQTHLVTAASFTSPYLTQLQHFLTTRVFIGPLAPEKLYEHLTYLLQLICQHFAGIQSYMTSLLNPEVKEEFENIPAHS